jgi:hypothetical protein
MAGAEADIAGAEAGMAGGGGAVTLTDPLELPDEMAPAPTDTSSPGMLVTCEAGGADTRTGTPKS